MIYVYHAAAYPSSHRVGPSPGAWGGTLPPSGPQTWKASRPGAITHAGTKLHDPPVLPLPDFFTRSKGEGNPLPKGTLSPRERAVNKEKPPSPLGRGWREAPGEGSGNTWPYL